MEHPDAIPFDLLKLTTSNSFQNIKHIYYILILLKIKFVSLKTCVNTNME